MRCGQFCAPYRCHYPVCFLAVLAFCFSRGVGAGASRLHSKQDCSREFTIFRLHLDTVKMVHTLLIVQIRNFP